MQDDRDATDFDELWDYDNPPATEAKFRQLVPGAGAGVGPGEAAQASIDRDRHCQLLTQIARAQGLQRKFDEAHRTLDEADDLMTGGMPVAHVRVLLERGRVFNSAGQPDRARPLFHLAWDLARSSGQDFHATDAAHMMAIVEKGGASLAWNEQAIAQAERSTEKRARNWLGSLYNNLGWSHHDRGDPARALECFQRALACREAQGKMKPIRIAQWCVARTMRSLGRVDEALAMQRALQADCEAAGEASDGFVVEEIGECLLALGRLDEARLMLAQAHAALSRDPWLAQREPARLKRLLELAGIAPSA